MSELKEGNKAPAFSMERDGGGQLSLDDFKGKKLVLYFYPKDDTSGCTTQACGFRDNLDAFNKLGVDIVGVSKDSVKKHDKFKEKHDLNFPLGSDEECKICDQYGVWKEKSMYGRKYMGIERSTFLIDENGIILKIWRKVKVGKHMDELIEALKDLKEAA